jgi:FkbM family methyltransferase
MEGERNNSRRRLPVASQALSHGRALASALRGLLAWAARGVAGTLAGRAAGPLRRLGRRALVQRWLLPWLRERLSGRELEIVGGEGKGLRFNLGRGHPGYLLGASEPLVQQVLTRHLGPGSVFYDIGANVGFLTLVGARLVGPSGAVWAFEPNPETIPVLRRNVALNGFRHVTVVESAVGARVGRARLVSDDPLTAHLGTAGVSVDVTTLDAMLEQLRPPDLVKIDVEGAEADVLAGMRKTLDEFAPVVICEVHQNARQSCARLLEAAGYDVTGLEPTATGMPHILALPRTHRRRAAPPVRG